MAYTMTKWLLVAAFAATVAINLAGYVRPVVLQQFGAINSALQHANHHR